MVSDNELAQDIKPGWFNLVRRMQAAARCQQGYAILTIRVVVDADGKPLTWTEPSVTNLSPRSSSHQWISLLMGVDP